MLDASEKAMRFARKGGYEGVLADEPVQALLVRQLEIVGEASANLSAAFVAAHQDWPWREMKSMRNRLIHGYASVDLDEVWATVQNDLPGLTDKLRAVLD